MRHAAFLRWVIGEGGGVGFRTDHGLMIAARDRDGWTVDDAWVPPSAWPDDGAALWEQVVHRIRAAGIDACEGDGSRIRFVCPVFEPERTRFALDRGLVLDCSWWHREVDATSPTAPQAPSASPGPMSRPLGSRAVGPRVAGAAVDLVPAPPVYDPGGPITFLRDVADECALDGAPEEARQWGSPLVVVDQPAASRPLADALVARGYVRHCDFFVTG